VAAAVSVPERNPEPDSEPDPEPAPEPAGPAPVVRILIALASIALGLAIVFAVPELRHGVSLALAGKLSELRHYVRSLGVGGAACLFGLLLVHAVIFYPSEILNATAGFVYGFIPGTAFALFGWLISGSITYYLGRQLARPVLTALLGQKFTRLEALAKRGGTRLLLAGRLIPIVPFSLLGYAAGAARVPFMRFAWTSVVGFLPLTAAVAYLGAHAQKLSLSDPAVWVIVAVVIGLLAASWLVPMRQSVESHSGADSSSSRGDGEDLRDADRA
jgi:uncharacterized membrane protein YdjX (TVP38/TMEM64 family)